MLTADSLLARCARTRLVVHSSIDLEKTQSVTNVVAATRVLWADKPAAIHWWVY
jgi:hypothetical protein